jgi:hypothetical protein
LAIKRGRRPANGVGDDVDGGDLSQRLIIVDHGDLIRADTLGRLHLVLADPRDHLGAAFCRADSFHEYAMPHSRPDFASHRNNAMAHFRTHAPQCSREPQE